jgi:hypothetical protein
MFAVGRSCCLCPLSPRHDRSLGLGWRRQPANIDEYINQAFVDIQQGVSLGFWGRVGLTTPRHISSMLRSLDLRLRRMLWNDLSKEKSKRVLNPFTGLHNIALLL